MKRLIDILLAVALLIGLNHRLIAQERILQQTVSGFVYESATGNPVSGAQVTIPDVASAVTDDEGAFTLEKSYKGAYLVVRVVGFATRQVPIVDNKPLKIFLVDDSYQGKYEEVILPFETRNVRRTTYALSSHKNRDDYKLAATTLETLLQGKVNGLNTVFRSGAPAAGANLFLNGFNSLNTNTQPLLVVDGLPYENQLIYSLIGGNVVSALSDIDIKDIDNITVLKDGGSIYGSQGSNGVILIQTLQAKDVATRINFYSYAGVNLEPSTKYQMLDAWRYKSYLTDMLSSKGLTVNEIQALPYINATKPVVERWGVSGNADYYRYNQSTNWQNEVFAPSFNQNYHLNVTGGNEDALYAISFGYLGHGGLVDNTSFSRYSTRVNARIKMTNWFKLNANMSFVYSERDLSFEGENRHFNPVLAGLIKAPFMSPNVYNVLGEKTPNLEGVDVFNVSNPLAITKKSLSSNSRFRFFGIMNGVLTFSKYFHGNLIFGLTTDNVAERVFMPQAGVYHTPLPSSEIVNESQQLRNLLMQLQAEANLNYQRTFDYVHDLNLHLGFRFQSSDAELDWGMAYNTSSDEMKTLGDGSNDLARIGGGLGSWRTASTYLNVEYGYLNKYFLSLNAALDGSSRFGKKADGIAMFDNVFGLFPSIHGAWLLTSEEFLSGIDNLDVLKLRAGYSVTGNDDIGNYSARQYYTSQNMLGAFGLVRGNIPNPALKWETNKRTSIGLDASFLKERLNMSVDLYSSLTEDLIQLIGTGSTSGFGYSVSNDGVLKNTGIDLNLSGRVINRSDIKWDLGLQVSTYKNQLVSMSVDESFTEISGGLVRTKVGEPIAQFYGYKTNGILLTEDQATAANLKIVNPDGAVFPFTAGDVQFVDRDQNNIINEADREVIGDPNPDFIGSLNSQLHWNRFILSTILTYSIGNDVYNAFRANLESMEGTDNQTMAAMYRWKADAQETNMPKAVWGDPMGNARFSDRWIEDGSYVRLKSVTLAYDLAIRKGLINSAQIYVTGNNLLTFSRYLGYDPEFSISQSPLYYGIDNGVSAQPRTLLLGIKIGL